jgi:hypothetical protein
MRIESARTLFLELTPQQAFDRLAGARGLTLLMPELESAVVSRRGGWRLSSRVGARRRSWRAGEVAREPGRRWALASASDGVGFRLEATFREHPRGCAVSVGASFEPPARWQRRHGRSLPRRSPGELLLWGLVAAGFLGLPWVENPLLVMAGYAVAGALFVVAILRQAGCDRGRRRLVDAAPDLRLAAVPLASAAHDRAHA